MLPVPVVTSKTHATEATEDKGEDTEETDNASPEKGTGSTMPNVFYILIDDMGYNDIGYQSMDLQGTTPNLDKLAAGGVKVIRSIPK